MSTFYVYVLKTLDGRVLYVGKGSGQRMFWHRRVLSRPQTKEFHRNVYKRMREFLNGQAFTEEKVSETNDETEALLHEQSLIRHYGFENLVNTQSHAFTGRKLKPEVGQIIASRLRGRKMPAEVKAKISAALQGRVVSLETGAKISAAKIGVPLSEAHRQSLTGVAKTYTTESKQLRNERAGQTLRQLWASGKMTGVRGQKMVFKNPEERGRRISEAKRAASAARALTKCQTA
jgi:hypothetical protein